MDLLPVMSEIDMPLLEREIQPSTRRSDSKQSSTPGIYSRRSRTHILGLLGKAFILTFAFIGMLKIGQSAIGVYGGRFQLYQPLDSSLASHDHVQTSTNSLVDSCNCGHSIEEAITNKCKYDSLSTTWLPPHCRDDELDEEWLKAGPNEDGSWNYYADQEGTVLLSVEEVAALADTNGSFWVTMEWHIKHCAFLWRKEHRIQAGISGKRMDKRNDGAHHIAHCEQMMLLRDGLTEINTNSQVTLMSDA